MIEYVEGNLLDSEEQFIAHQTNCRSSNGIAAGIAKQIFTKYPYSNVYFNNNEDKLGIIQIMGNGDDQRYIINMFAQKFPGKHWSLGEDTEANRKIYFYNCLKQIYSITDIQSVAFPDHIGCGLAGGDWEWYHKTIKEFAEHTKIKTVIYKLKEQNV